MKKSIFKLPLLLVAAVLLMFSACKKESTTEDDSVSAQDAAIVSNAVAVTANDAAAEAGQVSSFSGKTWPSWWNLLCGASVIDTPTNGGGQIIITYNGATCFGLIRTGSITITLTNGPWKNAGAVLTIAFDTFKVTDIASGGQYILNGTHTLTNETGGLAWEVIAGIDQSVTDAHRGQSTDMSITFPNGTQRVWSVDRTQSFASVVAGGTNTITVNEYSEHANNNDSWGTNRYGNSFTNSIADTISANNMPNDNSCTWLPYQGKYVHQIANRTATILFGANASGVQIGSPTHCGDDGYYITYTNANGQTHTRFIGYIH